MSCSQVLPSRCRDRPLASIMAMLERRSDSEKVGVLGDLHRSRLRHGQRGLSFLLALLHGEPCFLPADDSGGHDKDVLVTEVLGAPGAHFASVSTLVVTVEDERRVLVGRE